MSIATEIQRLQQAKADIKTAIENKGVNVGEGTIDTFAEKIGEISGGSVGDEYVYIPYLTYFGVDDLNIFNKATVELNIPKVTRYSEMLMQTVENTTVEHIIINGSQDGTITTLQKCFCCNAGNDSKIKRITLNCNLSKVDNLQWAFRNLRALEIVDGTALDFTSNTNSTGADYTFSNCVALREIRFVALSIKIPIYFSQSTELSNESIQSIIDGLADLTDSSSKKLTLHSSVIAKLTDEQQLQIMTKNWTVG